MNEWITSKAIRRKNTTLRVPGPGGAHLHSLHWSSPHSMREKLLFPFYKFRNLNDVGTQRWQTQSTLHNTALPLHNVSLFPQCNGKYCLIVSDKRVYHLFQSSQTTLKSRRCYHLQIKTWGWTEVKWFDINFQKWKITVSWMRLRGLYGGRESGGDT